MLEKRQKDLLDHFLHLAKSYLEYTIEVGAPYIYKLTNLFDDYNSNMKLCMKNCRVCKRFCILNVNHSTDCDCKT